MSSTFSSTASPHGDSCRSGVARCGRLCPGLLVQRGIVCTTGHSWATFWQMADACGAGKCPPSSSLLRRFRLPPVGEFQTYPMRGGILEAAFYFDELSVEVIAYFKASLIANCSCWPTS